MRFEIAKMMFDYRIIETDGTLVFNNWCYHSEKEVMVALDKFHESSEPVPLSSLSPGDDAVVEFVRGRAGHRLLELGFLPRTQIRVSHRAPLGDPISYEVRGATIALRSTEASRVMVRPSTTEPEGWFRHVETGRRRPDGDPEKEYIRS
jgi:ferrous iron transport protein A